MQKKRILVTGGLGFIGSRLCERLLGDGNSVIAADNFFSGSKNRVQHLRPNPAFEIVGHDVTTPYYTEVDQIYNLATPSSPHHYTHDPVMALKSSLVGSINILELAKRLKVPVLQVSSSKVYGQAQVLPVTEEYWGNVNPVGERSAYEEGKRAAETLFMAYHREYGVDIRIARLFNVFGPGMPSNDGRVIAGFILHALRGENITLYGNGAQMRTFLYIDDAVEGLVRLMETTEGDVAMPVNIGGAVEIRIDELAARIIKLTGSKSKIIYMNLDGSSTYSLTPSIGRARKLMDWEPLVPIDDGLIRTIHYFEERLRNSNQAFSFLSWAEMA